MSDETTEIVPSKASNAFASLANFESAQRMAKCLGSSDLVPEQYKDNIPNCILALEMSQRIGANPLMVMQNLYVVHGKPAWSSQFLIACINGCGRFSPLRYEVEGSGDDKTCVAWALDKVANERLESPPVSIGMAKREGWFGKKGSKWQTMPDLMLRYRAATYFARTYAPELTMGMQTQEEIIDVGPVTSTKTPEKATIDMDSLKPGKPEDHQGPGEKQPPPKPAAKKPKKAPEPKAEEAPLDVDSARESYKSALSDAMEQGVDEDKLAEIAWMEGITEGAEKCQDAKALAKAADAIRAEMKG